MSLNKSFVNIKSNQITEKANPLLFKEIKKYKNKKGGYWKFDSDDFCICELDPAKKVRPVPIYYQMEYNRDKGHYICPNRHYIYPTFYLDLPRPKRSILSDNINSLFKFDECK